jgi:hypothetical protein
MITSWSVILPLSQIVIGLGRMVQDSVDIFQKGEVNLQYISTHDQITDILTEPLSKGKYVYFKDKLGLVEITPLVEREC